MYFDMISQKPHLTVNVNRKCDFTLDTDTDELMNMYMNNDGVQEHGETETSSVQISIQHGC